MQSEIILNQIIILGIVACIGVIAAKANIINELLREGIAALVFNITLPLLIFTSFLNLDITTELLRNGFLVFVMALFSMFFLLGVGAVSSRVLRIKGEQYPIHLLHTAFGNIVFLGFPLMNALFPEGQALFYATLFYMASNTVMWTVGVNILSNSSDLSAIQKVKNLLNPNTIAFFAGMAVMLSGIKLPRVIEIPISGLGQTTTYLAMLYIGSILAQTSIKGVFKKPHVYVLSFNKLILAPTLLMLLFRLIQGLFSINIDPVAYSVVILQAATPCMTIIVVLAKRFNADDYHATENVFLSTLFSIFTLPLIYWLTDLTVIN